LRLPTFQTFELLVPPTEDEQAAIAAVLSDMDAELTALEARRDKTRAPQAGDDAGATNRTSPVSKWIMEN